MFLVIADEAADISNKEDPFLVLRFVDSSLWDFAFMVKTRLEMP